jgi:hypothetical protein
LGVDRVWLIVESSGCESKCGEVGCKGRGELPGRTSLTCGCTFDSEANALKEGDGPYGLEGTGGCGLEDAVDRALNRTGTGKGTEADCRGPASLLAAHLPLVGEAKSAAGEGDSATGSSVGFSLRTEPGEHRFSFSSGGYPLPPHATKSSNSYGCRHLPAESSIETS